MTNEPWRGLLTHEGIGGPLDPALFRRMIWDLQHYVGAVQDGGQGTPVTCNTTAPGGSSPSQPPDRES